MKPGDGGTALAADAASAGPDTGDASWGKTETVVADVGAPPDAPVDEPRRDTAGLLDSNAAQPDVPPFSCAALAPLIAKGVLSDGHAKRVLFSPDGKALLLVLAGDDGHGDRMSVVSLPDGEQHALTGTIKNAEWLGPGTILASTVDGDLFVYLRVASLGDSLVTPVAHKVCGYATTPDGFWLYYVRDCTGSVGSLYALDLQHGGSKQLATSVWTDGLGVSPSGRWVAYVANALPGDASGATSAVHVVKGDGPPYAVPIAEGASHPVFASDDLLLVQSTGASYGNPNIWAHRPGSSDASLLTVGDPGFGDYKWNANLSALLVAQYPVPAGRQGQLYLVDVANGGVVLLASDLINHHMFEMRIESFAIAPTSGRAIYVTDTPSDGGSFYGVASTSQGGGQRVGLASNIGRVVVSPFGDRVAIITSERTATSSTARATVVSATTGQVQFTTEQSAAVTAVAFVPGDRGLLFVSPEGDVASSRLRYLSFATSATLTLAGWSSNMLMPSSVPFGIETGSYPIDPTGCFAPVDSDLAPSGTRLVLLPQ